MLYVMMLACVACTCVVCGFEVHFLCKMTTMKDAPTLDAKLGVSGQNGFNSRKRRKMNDTAKKQSIVRIVVRGSKLSSPVPPPTTVLLCTCPTTTFWLPP